MENTHLLALICYLMLALTQTILAFVNAKGSPKQGRRTLTTLIMVIFPPFVFLFSLMKLYVYFFDVKANNDE